MKTYPESKDEAYQRYILKKDDNTNVIYNFIEANLSQYLPYSDPGFEYKLSQDFFAHLWEMNLVLYLLKHHFYVFPKSKSDGPDIRLRDEKKSIINIELVCPNTEKDDVKPKNYYSSIDINNMKHGIVFEKFEPEKIELRIQSVLDTKMKKIKRYISTNKISTSDINIIAVSGARLPFASLNMLFGVEINVLRSILPIGNLYSTIDFDTGNIGNDHFEYKPANINRNRSLVSKTIFDDNGYSCISGIIYSTNRLLDLEKSNTNKLFIIKNYNAWNKLDSCLNIDEILIDDNCDI